nr:O-antigen ligase family protein [Haloferula luteola]
MGALTALGSALQALRDKKTGRCLLSVSLALFILWTQFSHSVSRSGILLSVIGPCLWAGLLGWKYFGRNERRVIGLLLLLAIGTFALTESRVKSRLDATAEKVAELSENSENEESTSSAPIDFRVPIMQDTFTMISAAPLTGVGAGQFRYVFPQFREKSVLGWYRVVLHPESNWLEWAAECGVPATLGIAILLGIAYFQAARRIRQNRDRALRAACLAASALLPLHGLVDVPAHVLGLCFVSILLFALSQAPRSRKEAPLPRSWGFRPVGVLLLPASLALTGLLPGIPKPLTVRAPLAYRQTLQDLGVQGFPPKTYSSISALLEERQALASRSQSYTQALPLDPRWHHLYALCLLSFENQWGTADRQFSYERLLFPTMIQPVFHQADAWIPYDTHRSLTLWSEAVDRAHAIDSKSVARSPRLARTLAIFAIRKHRLRHPELRAEIDRLIQFLR